MNKAQQKPKNAIHILLCIAMLLTLCACGAHSEPPQEYEPYYEEYEPPEFSTPYESSVYYDRLKAVEFTGDYATDLLRVAFSQKGYHEGDSENDMHGGSDGSGNFTEYGMYLGSNGVPWCASFISWCARKAGIPEDVIGSGVNACADSFGVSYRRAADYTPKAGDIIIFDAIEDGLNESEPESEYGDHVGIVYRVTDTMVYYIDGNGLLSNGDDANCVMCHFRTLFDLNIKGYGVYNDEPAASIRQTDDGETPASYEASEYYDRLQTVELTGNYATDLLSVAFSQMGYHEGDSEEDTHGSSSGSGNWTEYGRFTDANGMPWCASFISWCARKADIPEDVIRTSITACADGFGVEYRAKEDYTPKAGDIVIFDWLKNGLNDSEPASDYGDHVGIVYRVTDTYMYYINGNGPDLSDEDTNCVTCFRRPLDDGNIKGYGVYTDDEADVSFVMRAYDAY